MHIRDKVAVITGGASGIGAALARRFRAEGARSIVVADLQEEALRAVAPKMAARGGGYLVHTASAAGLLSHIQSATYSVTKHAAVAFAEWVSIKYRDKGVRVSVLAPQAVRTPMTARPDGAAVASVDGMIEPEALADCVVAAMAREEFLILPHPGVRDYMLRKASDVDRWLIGMNRWRQQAGPAAR